MDRLTVFPNEKFPPKDHVYMVAYNPDGQTVDSCHVGITTHQDEDGYRLRFRPLYGWKAKHPIASVGLGVFGAEWGPIPLPRTYKGGEFLMVVPLDLIFPHAHIEPSAQVNTWSD